MKIDITRLKSGIDEFTKIKQEVLIQKEQLKNTTLLDLKSVFVEGKIICDNLDQYFLDCTVTGTMVLPCAFTLKPVPYPFMTKIEGNIEEMLEEINEISKKMENSIDIFPIIWENILMEIPMKVVSEEAKQMKTEGNGWRILSEEETNSIHPELQKLQNLLKEK